jgi:hypothetical protein
MATRRLGHMMLSGAFGDAMSLSRVQVRGRCDCKDDKYNKVVQKDIDVPCMTSTVSLRYLLLAMQQFLILLGTQAREPPLHICNSDSLLPHSPTLLRYLLLVCLALCRAFQVFDKFQSGEEFVVESKEFTRGRDLRGASLSNGFYLTVAEAYIRFVRWVGFIELQKINT